MSKKKETAPITKKTDDFAGGVTATKAENGEQKQVVRGEDVLKTLRAQGMKV